MTHFDLAISAQHINKRFGAVVAAADIALDVPVGQKLSLIGSNGAGKTTFVNMITGYIRPDDGQILLHGENIAGLPPREIAQRGIARSFQIPQLYEKLTVTENMLVAIASQGGKLSFWKPARNADALARADALLQRFDLVMHAQRKVAELPGGVRKLLDIAMALIRQPRVLLLDEPTSGVSADEKFPTMDTVMRALSHEAMTVLFIEHDMDIVQRFSDRVAAFDSGRIIADGHPDEVLSHPDVQRHVTGKTKDAAHA